MASWVCMEPLIGYMSICLVGGESLVVLIDHNYGLMFIDYVFSYVIIVVFIGYAYRSCLLLMYIGQVYRLCISFMFTGCVN